MDRGPNPAGASVNTSLVYRSRGLGAQRSGVTRSSCARRDVPVPLSAPRGRGLPSSLPHGNQLRFPCWAPQAFPLRHSPDSSRPFSPAWAPAPTLAAGPRAPTLAGGQALPSLLCEVPDLERERLSSPKPHSLYLPALAFPPQRSPCQARGRLVGGGLSYEWGECLSLCPPCTGPLPKQWTPNAAWLRAGGSPRVSSVWAAGRELPLRQGTRGGQCSPTPLSLLSARAEPRLPRRAPGERAGAGKPGGVGR